MKKNDPFVSEFLVSPMNAAKLKRLERRAKQEKRSQRLFPR